MIRTLDPNLVKARVASVTGEMEIRYPFSHYELRRSKTSKEAAMCALYE